MKKIIIISVCSLMLVPLLFTAKAQAAIYKCVKANADVYYNDKPCPVDDEQSQIKSVKDPVGGYIPPKLDGDNAAVASKGKVVGSSSSERSITKNVKKLSDRSTTGSNKSGSVTNSQSSSANSANTSSTSNETRSASNNNSTGNNSSSSSSVKKIIHKELDFNESWLQ